jgi:hypothetical protein
MRTRCALSASTTYCPVLVQIGECVWVVVLWTEETDLVQVENRYAWFLGQSVRHGRASEHWTDCVVDSMRDHNAPVIMEALCRARYKFLARQKIVVSKRWGFTNVIKDDYLKLKKEKNVSQYVFIWSLFLLGSVQRSTSTSANEYAYTSRAPSPL